MLLLKQCICSNLTKKFQHTLHTNFPTFSLTISWRKLWSCWSTTTLHQWCIALICVAPIRGECCVIFLFTRAKLFINMCNAKWIPTYFCVAPIVGDSYAIFVRAKLFRKLCNALLSPSSSELPSQPIHQSTNHDNRS